MRASIRFLTAILLAAGSLIACSKPHVVAQVGGYEITDRDVAYRNQIIELSYPQELRDLGFEQLVEAFQYAEVLRQLGFPLTPERLEQEAERIDKHTQMPDKLSEIKRVFGADRDSYLKVYVLPVLVARALPFEVFPTLTEVQESRKNLAGKAFEALKREPRDFHGIAERLRIPIYRYVLDGDRVYIENEVYRARQKRQSPLTPLPPPPSENAPSTILTRKIQHDLREIPHSPYLAKIYETETGWLIVRPLSIAGSKVRIEGMLIRKIPFPEWYEQQSEQIPVHLL